MAEIDWDELEGRNMPHNKTAEPEIEDKSETITYKDAPMPPTMDPQIPTDQNNTAVSTQYGPIKRIPTYQEDLAACEAEALAPTEELMQFAQGVFDKCLALARKKNADYAGAKDPLKNFRRYGAFGVAVRLDDKICRLGTLLDPRKADGPAVKDESIEDTLLDAINYAWILAKLRSEGQ